MATYCKYYKEEEYRSLDGGITWTAMGVYRKGDLLEYASEDCGYVPPTPTGNTKFSASYSGGETYSAACDGDTELTSATTKPSGYDYSAMTTAEIGPCVTSIGSHSFFGCRNLTNIIIPNTVTSIGDYAFYSCSGMTSITIPSDVTTISEGVFARCTGLTSVNIPSDVTSIGEWAFNSCTSLQSITVNATIPPTLGNTNAFDYTNNCPIYVPCASVDTYKAASGWSTYASRIQGIPPCGEPTPTGGTKFYATYNGGATYSAACDGDTTLTTATTRPSGHNYAAMQTAEIGSCITSIGSHAFDVCVSLTSVTIPNCVTSIGECAFASCDGFTSIGPVGSGASVEIPSGVTTIGKAAFYKCRSLTNVNIPNSVTSIGNDAFWDCTGLTTCTIGSGVTSIGGTAFGNCSSLTSCTIGSGVTSIGDKAFYRCSGLTSIDIPNSVTSIGNMAFRDCTGLTSVTCNAVTPPTLEIDAFTKERGTFTNTPIESGTGYIYVPCQSLEAYKTAWSIYASRIQCVEPTPTFDGKFRATYTGGTTYSAACDDNTTLESGDTRPSGYDYSAMTTAEIGPCVTSIGYGAFEHCSGLTSIIIPNSVTSIGTLAFNSCYSLTSIGPKGSGASVEIPSGVTSIGWGAFQHCSGLTSIIIPNSVTSIGSYAFYGCNSLTSIDIPDSVTSIGGTAFSRCTGLTSCTIGSGVTSIKDYAFANCSGLTSVTVNATTHPTLNNATAFQNTPIASGTGYIYVPSGSVNSYKAARGWSTYADRIQPIT